MEKTRKIIYWISTGWLALGMVSTGVGQLMGLDKGQGGIEVISNLGYPNYILTLLGIWKILGAIAVLVPKTPLVKEWAYAGFFFAMSGAVFSHIASGNPGGIFPALLLLVLTVVSWYFRPPSRKLVYANSI
jgi:DoxX-like family